MHSLYNGLGLCAAANIRLVGGNDEQEASGFQPSTIFRSTGKQAKIFEHGRRIGLSLTNHLDVERAVTIEENCGAFFLDRQDGRRWAGGQAKGRRYRPEVSGNKVAGDLIKPRIIQSGIRWPPG